MRQIIIRYLSIVLFSAAVSLQPTQLMAAANWGEIDQLQEQGKFADIPAKLDVIIQQAQQQAANKDWRDALLLRANISFSQDAEETLDKLINSSWPKDQDSPLLQNLYLGD